MAGFFIPTSGTSDVPSKSPKYYVYILRSLKDQSFYIGFTTDLKSRLSRHARGGVQSTKLQLPYKLIHYEYFINRQDAISREEYLKSGFGRKQLQQILKNTLN